MLLEIIRHTPVWVWALLAALLTVGALQTRTRQLTRTRLLALPLALLGLGLWTVSAQFAAAPTAPLAWASALLAGSLLGQHLPRPAGTLWDAARARLQVPGSWIPLAVIVAIFTLRYGATVMQVLHPAWRGAEPVVLSLALVYGTISGLLLGRALGLLALTRQSTIGAHAAC